MKENVTVFTKSGCIQCRMTKRFLSEHDVQYKENNINQNPEFVSYLKDKGFQSVPVVFTNDNNPIVGFRPDELKEIVK